MVPTSISPCETVPVILSGGHLLDGNLVYTTAEIVAGEATSLRFTRETDPATGFKELSVKKRD
jgi:predicted DNA-binding protein with PD1-like motif